MKIPILSRLGSWLIKASGASITMQSANLNTFDRSYLPDTDPAKLLKRYTSWVYACVNRNATYCSQVPLRVYQKRTGDNEKRNKRLGYRQRKVKSNRIKYLRKDHAKFFDDVSDYVELENHPSIERFSEATPEMNGLELIQFIISSLDTCGNAFLYKQRANGVIMELWPLFAQEIKVIADKTDAKKISHYEYGTGQNKEIIQPNDIIHFKYISLTNPLFGMSPLAAACSAADLYINANIYELSQFENGGRPDVQLTYPENSVIQEPERKRIEHEYYRKFKGSSNAGRLFIASGGAKIEQVSLSPREMAFLQGRKWSLEEIAGIFGVPMSKLVIQDVSRANAGQGDFEYMNQTIRPRLNSITSKLNDKYGPDFEEGLYFAFDDPTPVDEELRLRQIQTHISVGYSTINEERELDGLEPIMGGDETPADRANQAMEIANSQAQTAEDQDEDDEKKPEKSIKPQTPRISVASPNFLPKRLMKLIQDFLSDQCADVLSNIHDNQLKAAKANPEDIASGSFGDMSYWNKKLEKILRPAWKGILKYSGQRSLNGIGNRKVEVLDENSPRVLSMIEKRTGDIVGLNLTSQKLVRNAVKEGIASGEGPAQIKQRIRAVFEEVTGFPVSGKRAELIARTETIWAHNAGVQEGWKQSGVVSGKEWFAAEDERMCDYCGTMHGKIVGIEGEFVKKGETFFSKDGKPLKIDYENVAHPPLHPDCRCAILPVLLN